MNEVRENMLRQLIEKNNLGALIFWRPDELVMLTGYLPQWGLSFLVYSTAGGAVLYIPELEPEDILPRGIPVEKYPWGVLGGGDPWEELYRKIRTRLVKEAVQQRPVSFIKHIGGSAPCRMPGEQPLLPASLLDALGEISQGGYRDSSPDLLKLYEFKTMEDREALRLTHRVAERAVKKFYELAQAGISEKEMANGIETAVQEMTGIRGIGFAKAWPMVQSGNNTCQAGRYNRTTARRLRVSELVLVEMGICVNGYWADITRTAAIGTATAQQEELFHTVKTAQEKALSLMRPGVAMSAVDAAARDHIAGKGWGHLFNHVLGHPTGFRYHDPGMLLATGSAGILEEGMVLTVEPGVYGEELGEGLRIEDNVLITAGGYECLSDFQKELTTK